LPTGIRPLISGKVKVVDPSPDPYRVDTALNRPGYATRPTVDPSHNNHPVGAVTPPYIWIIPGGLFWLSEDNVELKNGIVL